MAGDGNALAVAQFKDLGGIGADAGHGAVAGGQLSHEVSARGGQSQDGRFVERAGPAEGRQFTEAVADGQIGGNREKFQNADGGKGSANDGGLNDYGEWMSPETGGS